MKKQLSLSNIFDYIYDKLIFITMEEVEGQIIEERDIIEVTPEQPKEGCKKCKNKGLKSSHIVMIVTSFYLIFAAIYGTIKLIKDVTHYFGY